ALLARIDRDEPVALRLRERRPPRRAPSSRLGTTAGLARLRLALRLVRLLRPRRLLGLGLGLGGRRRDGGLLPSAAPAAAAAALLRGRLAVRARLAGRCLSGAGLRCSYRSGCRLLCRRLLRPS